MNGEKYVAVDGIRTRYFEAGAGEKLLLIHAGQFGSPNFAHNALDWELNFEELASSFHVFAFDKVGQGRSDNPPRPGDYTISYVVRHALGFIRALGLGSIHVIGHSRGGYVAARLAVDHPDLVSTCTVLDSNTLAPGIGRNDVVMARAPLPRLSRDSQRWVMDRYSYSSGHVTETWLDEVCAISQLPKYEEASRLMEREDLRTRQFLPDLARQREELFSKIRGGGLSVPFMLVWGYNDPTATLDQALALYDLIAASQRCAELHVLNQAGHFSHRERPVAFHSLVRAFVAGQR